MILETNTSELYKILSILLNDNITSTEGLFYELSEDGTYALVVDYQGTTTNVIISSNFADKTVTKIDDSSFIGKTLETVTLPDTITVIGALAFYSCTNLTTVIINSPTLCELVAIDTFERTPIANGSGYIYVPNNLVGTYKVAKNWSTYSSQIKALSELGNT